MDGEWRAGNAGEGRDVLNPANETRIAVVYDSSLEQVSEAVASARRAFKSWSRTPVRERAAFLRAIGEGLQARSEELTNLITAEVGTPLRISSIVQVTAPATAWSMYADLIEELDLEWSEGHSLVMREPVGVIACITPWNFPLHQITLKVAAALAAGCTVVLKPSEVAPLNARVLADVIHEAGLPNGVFNLVFGDGAGVGEALVSHPDIDMVSFTGSRRAGSRVAAVAAGNIKRVALELGGKSAAVVLDDADLRAAARGIRNSCFLNSGQTCDAHTRMLVPRAKYEEMKALVKAAVEEFVAGDPTASTTKLGPLVSSHQRDVVRDYIHKGIDSGADLITGGPEVPEHLETGYYVIPTVFGNVAPDSDIAQEEIFGPVLSIIVYDDEDEAVEIANGTVYGLGAGVWSADVDRAMAIAKRLQAGQVDINGAPYNAAAPFGGFKQSGFGREAGRYGIEEFFELRSIQRPK